MKKQALLGLMIAWIAAVAFGTFLILRHEFTGSLATDAPAVWPAASSVSASESCTLVMFAHPQCPCTRASLGELARVLSSCSDKVRASVCFYSPRSASADWLDTPTWKDASTIPGVTIVKDHDGVEAKRFRAEASGTVVLYDKKQRLLYEGGITGSRGHAGDNIGSQALLRCIQSNKPATIKSPVFGCGIAPNAMTLATSK